MTTREEKLGKTPDREEEEKKNRNKAEIQKEKMHSDTFLTQRGKHTS